MMSVIGRLSLTLIVAVLLTTQVALAKAPSDTKVEDVLRVLRHEANPSRKDLAVAGNHIDGVLADLVGRTRLEMELRVRAARALGLYQGRQVETVLTTTLSNPDMKDAIRSAAMIGLARAEGVMALNELTQYLKDPLPAIRIGSARAIAVVGDERARTLLMDAIHHEKVLEVRLVMDEALDEMTGR